MLDSLLFQDVLTISIPNSSILILSSLLILWAGPSNISPSLKLTKVCFCYLQPKNPAWGREELWEGWLLSARLGLSSSRITGVSECAVVFS